MLNLFKKFVDHQKALWNGETVNPKPIAWIASLLFIPSVVLSCYVGKYINQEIIQYLNIPTVIKMLMILLIYVFSPFVIPIFIGNNAR